MKSVHPFVVILMTALLLPSAEAASISLSGGPGDLTPAQLSALGVVEDPSVCSETRKSLESELKKTSDVYLSPGSFPLPKPPEAVVDPGGCDAYQDGPSDFERMTKLVGTITAPSHLDLACVAGAQKIFQAVPGPYRACPSGEMKPRSEGPCRTSNATATVSRALTLVSECLGIDRRELFRIGSESTGLVADALTPRAERSALTVRDTDLGFAGGEPARKAGSAIRTTMGNNAFCAGLYRLEQNFVFSDEKSVCERMSQPAGAFLPLFFQAKAYLYLRAELEAASTASRAKFASEADYRNVLRAVAVSGAVAGEVKARAVFSTILLRSFKNADDFLKQYQSALVAAVPAEIRTEVDRFPSRLDALTKDLKKATGGRECF